MSLIQNALHFPAHAKHFTYLHHDYATHGKNFKSLKTYRSTKNIKLSEIYRRIFQSYVFVVYQKI